MSPQKMVDCELLQEVENRDILHWNFRGFKDLPSVLEEHGEQIQEIYLKWNHLVTLPSWIHKMTNLTNIYLFGNEIKSLPEEFGLLKLLQTLELQNNSLESLPKSIGCLKNLNVLNLQYNELKFLPPEFVKLKALSHLNLLGNKLMKLCPNISQMKSLYEVVLDYNCLTVLPSDIVYLPNLSFLSLNGNNLLHLPSRCFLSRPLLSFIQNPYLNYIEHSLGCFISESGDFHIEGGLWNIKATGCSRGSGFLETMGTSGHLILWVPSFQLHLVLPYSMRAIHQLEAPFVPSLFELCCRTVEDLNYATTDCRVCNDEESLSELPFSILEQVRRGPEAVCHICNGPIFREAAITLVRKFNASTDPDNPDKLIACMFYCSRRCSRKFLKGGNSSDASLIESMIPWECTFSTKADEVG